MVKNIFNQSSPQSYVEAPEFFIVEGVLKWYNPKRGYGFLVPTDGSSDVMVHRDLLESAGFPVVNPGAVIRCEAEVSERGALAVRIISVLDRALQLSQELMERMQSSPEEMVPGVVKWYNENKGFGFALSADVDGDVLLSRPVLMRCNVPMLAPGQRLLMKVEPGERGNAAVLVRTIK